MPNDRARFSVVAALHGADSAPSRAVSPRLLPPPASARQWADVSLSSLQLRGAALSPERSAAMLEETAQALLSEDTRPNARKGPSPRRWLAARFFLLASAACARRGSVSSLRSAVRLAESAVSAHRCALTAAHCAWRCYGLSRRTEEAQWRAALEATARDLAIGIADTAIGAKTEGLDKKKEKEKKGEQEETAAVPLARVAWLLALLDVPARALLLAQRCAERNRSDVDALVLLALLWSAQGEYARALDVARHVEQLRPRDIVGGVLLAAVCHAVPIAPQRSPHHHNSNKNDNRDSKDNKGSKGCDSAEMLAVCMARVQAASCSVLSHHHHHHHQQQQQQQQQQQHCQEHCQEHCYSESHCGALVRGPCRVAGHWALLAHTARATGCAAIADAAVDGGLDFIARARDEHRGAFADLLCCCAGAQIDAGENAAAQETLDRALEAAGAHAEAYALLGRIRLCEARAAELSSVARNERLAEAAHYFKRAIRCGAAFAGSYEGMAHVREAQGAVELSLSFFASAAELESRRPVIPYERFLYLLDWRMPALGIACSGATYYKTTVLDIMRHRCKEGQPINKSNDSASDNDDNVEEENVPEDDTE